MGAAVDRKGVKSRSKKAVTATVEPVPAYDNPLVPNAMLREMYQKMVELQLLGELHAKHYQQGQEAARVSVTRSFGSGDLLLDSQPGPLSDFLLGYKLKDVLPILTAAKKLSGKAGESRHVLPYVEDAEARLFAGVGAAFAIKGLKRTDVAVVLLEAEEGSHGAWKRTLRVAAANELPAIFVVLPELKGKERAPVSAIANKCGVSAIAVEGTDAVALYRVMQESLLRARNAGGPAVVECVGFRPTGKKKRETVDPMKQLREYLLGRQVCTAEWMHSVASDFRKQLAIARSGSGMEV